MSYKIGVVVTWFTEFGDFPPFLDAWRLSAEKNPTIDFLIFSDSEIKSNCANMIFHKITFKEMCELCEKKAAA